MNAEYSKPLAFVSEIAGNAWVKSPDGSCRQLHKGDAVYEHDVVVADNAGFLKLQSANGVFLDVREGGEVVLNIDLFIDRNCAGDEDSVSSAMPGGAHPENMNTIKQEVQKSSNESSGIHGYLRVARLSGTGQAEPYHFSSFTSGYQASFASRNGGSNAFLDGRATMDERIVMSNSVTRSYQETDTSGFGFRYQSLPSQQKNSGNWGVPDAVDDQFTVIEDGTLTVSVPGILGNDSTGGDGGVLSVMSYTNPLHGTLLQNPDGSFIYTPEANYNGHDSYTYTIRDADGDTSTAKVTITVTPVNDVPAAVNDTYMTKEDTALSGNVSTNDTPSGDGGNVWSLESGPTHGTLALNADGSFVYMPEANYNGVDSFSYRITDVDGDTSTATAMIMVNPADDFPEAVNDIYTTNEDTVLSGSVSANDTPSGDGGNVWSLESGPTHGTLALNPDGSFLYTPAANYNGPDSFTYKITDADGDSSTATAMITVNPADDFPEAVNDSYTTNEDTVLSGSVSANDIPSGDGGNVWSLESGPTHGTLALNPDGSFLYTPAANYNGPDSFTYKITDVDGDTSTATASITVNPVNDPPQANPDINSVKVNNTIVVDVLYGVVESSGNLSGMDTDPDGDTLTVSGVKAGTAGSANEVGTSGVGLSICGTYGHLTLNMDGSYTYSADTAASRDLFPTETVQDVFSYAISDGNGGSSFTTLTVTIAGTKTLEQKVYEDALTIPPNLSQGNYDAGAVSVVSGSLSLLFPETGGLGAVYTTVTDMAAGDPDPLVYTTAGNVLSSLGVQVHYSADSGGTVLAGYADANGDGAYTAGADRIVFTMTIDDASSGAYTFALNDQVDHPEKSGDKGMLSIDLAPEVSVTEADGDRVTVSSGFVIDIQNDVPKANANNLEMTAKPIDTNLTLIMDNSGSMRLRPATDGYEMKITIAARDAEKLIDDYSALGNVKVQIIAFSDTAQALAVWVDSAEAKAILESMANGEYIDGATNYDDPLALVMETYGQEGKLASPATQNVSYFISDGQPNRPDGSAGIDSSEQAQWEAFLNENAIDSYAIGVEDAVYGGNLDPIAYNGMTGTDQPSIVVLDINDLSKVLSNTVVPSAVTGTLIESSGADAPAWVGSITIDKTTYTFNRDTDSVTVSGTYRSTFDPLTHTLAITTLGFGNDLYLNSILVVNMETGAFTYMAPRTVVNSSFTDYFSYVIRDYDGDTSTASGSITVDSPFVGTAGDDTLSGGNGADYISGLDGNDILYGGSGNDILDGGTGKDSLYGGAGNDTLAWDPNDGVVQGNLGTDTLIIPVDATFDFGPGLSPLSGIEVLQLDIHAQVLNLAPGSVASLAPSGSVLSIKGDGTNGVELSGAWTASSSDPGYSVFTSGLQTVKIEHGIYLIDRGTDAPDSLTGIDNGSQNDWLLGYAGDDTLNGGDGNDLLDGGSGSDLLRGGSGNDILVYDSSDSLPGAVDGGSGTDTLMLTNGDWIDFGDPGNNADRFTGIEIIDLASDPAANAIENLDSSDLMTMTGGSGTLSIFKGIGDTVSFGDMVLAGSGEPVALNGSTCIMDRYTGGGATVYVQHS
jgi:VCBS repeat-containing protein